MQLRAYTPDDLEAVYAINQGSVPAVGSETSDALARIGAQSLIALVAEDDDGTIGGFCMALDPEADYASGNFRWFGDRYDDFVYLDRIAISPERRRRGLGRAMYAEVERLAASRRPTATEFCLEVNLRPRNDVSLAFHAELGFVEVGRRETEYDAFVSLMSKSL